MPVPFLVEVLTSLMVGMCCRALILADIGKKSTVMLEASTRSFRRRILVGGSDTCLLLKASRKSFQLKEVCISLRSYMDWIL